MKQNILIIGGVACGPKTASRLKRIMPDANVTLVERDSLVSYGACGLPYYVERLFPDIKALIEAPGGYARTPEFFKSTKGFDLKTRTEAIKIDPKNKTVLLKNLDTNSEEEMAYDKLVIATGGSAFKPPIPGLDLKNVWFMTHPNDASTLAKEIISQGLNKAVMVGAGFIGLEMAEALIENDLEVDLVEMADQIMPGILDADVASFATKHLKDKGVNCIFGERVTGIKGEDKAASVETDKQSIPADAVIIAVGTRPNDILAREAGLDCMQRGGIIINSYCQTSDPNIYAGGDCAVNKYVDDIVGNPLFVPLGSTANKHGRIIANHIGGIMTPFNGISCSAIVQVFDYSVGRTGLTERQANELNLDFETVTYAGKDLPMFMPDSKLIVIKMLASKRDRKLLGVQAYGPGNISKRLDVAASIIYYGGTLDDIPNIDLGYAPPFSPAVDNIAVCAHVLSNKMDGLASGISALEAKKRIENGNVFLLDVRSKAEIRLCKFPYETVEIPIDEVRANLDKIPKDKEVLAFCQVSLRGYEAQRILNSAGYENVSFIEAGVLGWPY